MAENHQDQSQKIPLKRFLADFRSPLDDRELMQRYGLSARSFVTLVTTLMKKNLLDKRDLDHRKEIAVERDLAKESQFLSSLYICPNCSHPSPTPFKRCPACGSEPAAQQEEPYPPITTSEGHAYIPPTRVLEEVEVEEITETEENGHEPENKGKPSAISSVRSFFSRKAK